MTAVSLLSELTDDEKRSFLRKAQLALIDLQTGNKGVSFSYAQGDGAKSVSYDRTSIDKLQSLIRDLQRDLGMCVPRRRPIRPYFR